jgi:Ca-activated chloride channel family protein
MIFEEPLWLWALIAVPLVAGAEAWATRCDRTRVSRLVARALWAKVVRTPAEHWRHLRLALLLVGVTGIVLALGRPQWGIVREKVEREGVDVVLLLDTSGSMATEDVSPNRFQLAKTALVNLVQRLEGERFALVAFEGQAYTLVPLTLDADAIGLFLDTLEPGTVPSPGTSLGAGLAQGLAAFADTGRQNKAMILVSDGEDLEGELESAVERAKAAGVVVHAVGVGTPAGQPVPDFDKQGNRSGYKKNEDGSAAVSRLHPETLEAIARGTGGRAFALTPSDLSLAPLAATIEGMEQKTLAREYSYRKKERFQVPLGVGLAALAVALLLPPPDLRRRGASALRAVALIAGVAVMSAPDAWAGASDVSEELLLKPTRLTAEGRRHYDEGNGAKALEAFSKAAAARPNDPRARFNLADALYKAGKFDEAKAIYESLASDARSPLAVPARYNLGNTHFQKRDFADAVKAYREALRLSPHDGDARRNLELALEALKQEQKKRDSSKQDQKPQDQQQKDQQQKDQQEKDQQEKDSRQKPEQQKENQQRQQSGQGEAQRPKSDEEKERERFEKETGMPKERAMQLLDALQQNEKAAQKKLQAERQKSAKRGKDW